MGSLGYRPAGVFTTESATYARDDDRNLAWLDPYFGGTCLRLGYRRAVRRLCRAATGPSDAGAGSYSPSCHRMLCRFRSRNGPDCAFAGARQSLG